MPKIRDLVCCLLAGLALVALGCRGRDAVPQLLTVLDVGPHVLGAADTLEITGSGFPSRKTARVTLTGTMLRPGHEPETDVTVDTEGTSLSSSKIGVTITDGVLAAICGKPETAGHTTFRGTVEVSFPAATPGALPITGTVRDVVLDIRPLAARRAAVEAEAQEGERVLSLLGMKVADEVAAAGGLTVVDVAEDSAAATAGVTKNDVLVAIDGLTVLDKGDVVPSGRRRFVTMSVLHDGDPQPTLRQVAIRGYRPRSAHDLLAVALIVGTAAAAALFFASPLARGLTWVERWAVRRGPARRSGWLVWLFDRLLVVRHGGARREPLAETMPWVIFFVASGTTSAIPFGRQVLGVDPDLGAAFLLALGLALAVALGSGRRDDGRWSFLRGLRLTAWVLLYHVPSALAAIGGVAMSGSFLLVDLVRGQGGEPWNWSALRTPIGFLLLALFFAPVLVDPSPPQSRVPDADAGPSSHAPSRGGVPASLEWASLFVLSSVGVAVFLGGWAIPFVDRAAQERSLGLSALGATLFLAKTWGVSLCLGVAREIIPRIRIDQTGSPFLRLVLPLTIVTSALIVGFLAWDPAPMLRRILALVGSGLFALLVVHVGRRVVAAIRGGGAQPHVSPFL